MKQPTGQPAGKLVQLRWKGLAAKALVSPLDGCCKLAFALRGRLFIKLPGAKLGEQASLLDGALESAQRHLERLVFLDANCRHALLSPEPNAEKPRILAYVGTATNNEIPKEAWVQTVRLDGQMPVGS